MAPRKIVVVGASLAGLRAVETLRRDGYDGKLALVGAEEHLPYDRPPLSKQLLSGEWELERVRLASNGLGALELDLHLGQRATELDLHAREVVLAGGARLAFDAAILATGASPRMLPDVPALEGIHVLRTLDDSLAIRDAFDQGARVAVVGAGFIGAEVAATARGRGLAVTVLEALPLPLIRGLGPELAGVCARLHLDHGVDLRCDVTVDAFEGDGRVERLVLSDGSRIDVDVVVIGVGVRPETGWLEGSGLMITDGVVCDATCAAAPGVYAAGDVARWYNPLFGEEMRVEHWTNAAEQGVAAARAVLAGPSKAKPFAPVPFFWSDQYDTKIQFVGRSRPDDEVRVVHGSPDEGRFVAIYGREGRLSGALAFTWPRLLMGYRRLLAESATWDAALAHAATVE
jgi:NADPH-dependent 2,4-dienoyl-CoA reductase/sulfur reductase-like enzyme